MSQTATAAAYGVFSQGIPLQSVVATLNQKGVQNQDICVLLAPAHPIAARMHEMNTDVYEPRSKASLSRLVEWVSKLGAVSVPGVGVFIRSGAYMGALMESNERSVLCRNWKTLSRLGIPEQDTARLENHISGDSGMIYVACEESDSQRVAEILKETGAQEISSVQLTVHNA